MTSQRDRAVGALVGLAIGDALGTTLEFAERDTLPPLTDMVGGGPFGLKPGQWTDDTAMALALAESLNYCDGFDPHDAMRRFVNWWEWGYCSCTGECFDIGITTRAALARFRAGGSPFQGDPSPHSAGNGGLMRLAPVPIRWLDDAATRRTVAREQTLLTHGAPSCIDASEIFADMIAEAIVGQSKSDILTRPRSTSTSEIALIVDGSYLRKSRDQIRSSGYVVHSLEAALWAIADSSDFSETLLKAANLGDDADTVAAIAGQLAGALYGLDNIPKKWLSVLAWRAQLEDQAARLFSAGSSQ